MPQMAPLNWITLFIYFTLIILIINNLNYYFFSFNYNKKTMMKIEKKINWKW